MDSKGTPTSVGECPGRALDRREFCHAAGTTAILQLHRPAKAIECDRAAPKAAFESRLHGPIAEPLVLTIPLIA